MSQKDKEIVLEIHKLLKRNFRNYSGLYFYGSRLAKKHRKDSDYDIVVTFRDKVDWKIENEVWGELALFELEKDVCTDVKIYQFSVLHQQNTPFRQSVIEKGLFYGV